MLSIIQPDTGHGCLISSRIPEMAVWYPAGNRRFLSDIQPAAWDGCLNPGQIPEMAVWYQARYQRWLSDIRPDTGDGCLISVRIPEMAVWYPARCRRWLSDIRSGIGYPRSDRLFYNRCQTTVYCKCYSNKGLFWIKNAAHFFKWWIKMPVFSHSKFHVCYLDTVFLIGFHAITLSITSADRAGGGAGVKKYKLGPKSGTE